MTEATTDRAMDVRVASQHANHPLTIEGHFYAEGNQHMDGIPEVVRNVFAHYAEATQVAINCDRRGVIYTRQLPQ